VRDDVRDVLGRHLAARERLLTACEARLGQTPKIEHDLEQAIEALERSHARREVRGKAAEESFELIALLLHAHLSCSHCGVHRIRIEHIEGRAAVCCESQHSERAARRR